MKNTRFNILKNWHLLLAILICMLFTFSGMAQTALLENFDGGSLPTDWISNSKADGSGYTQWSYMSTHARCAPIDNSGTGKYAMLDSYFTQTSENPINLITKSIDLSSGGFLLEFYAWVGSGATAEPIKVDISTDDGTNWISDIYTVTNGITESWEKHSVDLTSYTTSTVKIKFKGYSNYGFGTTNSGLDDVKVYKLVSDDAEISALISPSNSFPSGTKDVIITLKNAGTNNITSVNIDWSVNGASQTTYNWMGDLASGATEDVTLGSYDFSVGGTYTIIAETSSPNSVSDNNTSNDQLTTDVTAIAPLSLPYTQNFDGVTAPAIPSDWSAIDSDASSSTYVKTDNYGMPNSSPNELVLYNYGTLGMDLLLVSPLIADISAVNFIFYASGSASNISVGTMSDPADASTYSEFESLTPASEYVEYKIDFTTYAGTDNYIAIKHPTAGYYKKIYIDDVTIQEPKANDASLSALINPNDKVTVGANDIIVTLENNGTNNLTSVNIDWDIDGGTTTSYSWTGDLATGTTEDVTIGTHNFDAEGTFTLNVSLSLPNGVADENTSNDAISENIQVYPSGTVLETEPNNTWDAAGVIGLANNKGLGNIEANGTDYWSVDALDGEILTATITCSASVFLYLYQEGTYINILTSGEGFKIPADGTYHVAVISYNSSAYDYDLDISLESDTEAPNFISTPTHEATNISKGTNIEIVFNELVYYNDGSDLDAANLLNCFGIKEGSESGIDVAFSAEYNESLLQVTLDPSTDLNYETDYYVILAANMIQDEVGNLASDSTYYFTTKAAPVVVTMPLRTGFEEEDFPPVNWELTSDSSGWTREESSGDVTFPEGSYGAKFYSYSGTSTLRTPVIDMSDATAPRIKFSWQNTPGYFGGLNCVVNVSTDGGDSFTEVYNVEATDENWIDVKIDLTEFSDETIIEFDLGNDFSSVYLDDISISEKPTTPIFSISHDSYDFGTVDLLDENNTVTFTIENEGGGTMNLTSAVLSGIDVTEYEVLNAYLPVEITTDPFDLEVKFNPVSEGAKSATLTLTVDEIDYSVSLTGEGHDSEIKGLPFEYGFEDVDTDNDEFNQDWSSINSIGGMSWCKVRASSANTGINALNMYNGGTTTGNIMAIMPVSNIDVVGSVFSFYAYISGSAILEVGYVTDVTDASTFVKIEDIDVTMAYTKFDIDLSSISISGSYYLTFRHGLSGQHQSIYIDDIRWAIPSDDATLSGLTSDLVTIEGFSPDVYTYDIVLSSTATVPQFVGATANSEYATVDITQASTIPGSAIVLVTAENGTTETYTINYVKASSNDASLKNITVNGESISGFDPITLNYDVELPLGTTAVPTIVGIATDSDADVAVSNASSLPGTTEIVVTSADASTTSTYKINLAITKNNDATLSDLLVDGVTITDFDPALLAYTINLEHGTVTVPSVTAEATDSNANVVINNASSLPGTTTVEVTAEDENTTITYEVIFSVGLNDDATLMDLTINGSTVIGFDGSILSYDIELPYGTTVVPIVEGTAADSNAEMTINEASSLPGITEIIVTAEDGETTKTYEVNFTIVANDNATLSGLQVDGVTISDFDATTFNYDVELAYGTITVPTVTCTTSDPNADVVVNPASSLPGTTEIVVTAEDGETSKTYEVNFTIAANNIATLSNLMVDGETVSSFATETFTYNIVLESGTTQVPVVTVTCTDSNADAVITNATELPGTTTVEVTAEDGVTTETYHVNFTVATGIDFALEQNLKVFPIPSNGEITIDLGSYSYNQGSWNLYSLTGQVVVNGAITESHFKLRNLNKGTYILVLSIDNQAVNRKIIIK